MWGVREKVPDGCCISLTVLRGFRWLRVEGEVEVVHEASSSLSASS